MTASDDMGALSALIWRVETTDFGGYSHRDALAVTRSILDSDWLAARDAEVRRAAGEQIAQAIEADRFLAAHHREEAARIAREVTQ